MSITTIATHIEPGPQAASQASAVLSVAQGFGARVTALAFAAEVTTGEPPAEPAIMTEAARLNVHCETRGRASYAQGIGQELAAQGRVSDLVVLPVSGLPSPAERMLLDAAIFDSGRPVLVLPPGTSAAQPQRVAIAWDGSTAAVRAAHNAMPFLAQAQSVLVLFVTDDKEPRQADSGEAFTALLLRHSLRASYLPVQRAGRTVLEALCDTARQNGASLLTMGCLRHSPLREVVFGSATTDLLHGDATMAVLASA